MSTLAGRVLAACVPQLAGGAQDIDLLARNVLLLREMLGADRRHYLRFISLLGSISTSLLSEEERGMAMNDTIADCVDVWEAYTSRLSEFSRKIQIPLRILSFGKAVVTLDPLGAAKEFTGGTTKSILDRQEERFLAFIHKVSMEVKKLQRGKTL